MHAKGAVLASQEHTGEILPSHHTKSNRCTVQHTTMLHRHSWDAVVSHPGFYHSPRSNDVRRMSRAADSSFSNARNSNLLCSLSNRQTMDSSIYNITTIN